MSQVVRPSWELLDRVVAEAKRDLIICAPWISAAGLERVQRRFLNAPAGTSLPRFQFWARMADVNTDSPGILELVERLDAAGVSSIVRDSPVLHAKIYLADCSLALVTSANLSDGGFSSNLEAAVVISEPNELHQVVQLLTSIEAETTVVTTRELEHFVAEQRPLLLQQATSVPPAVVPVWRRPGKPPLPPSAELARTQPSPHTMISRAIDLRDLIKAMEASIKAAHEKIQHVDLHDWRGRKARVWVCPTFLLEGPSPDLTRLCTPYFLGELQLDQPLPPEQFTQIEGTIQEVLDNGRALFRQKRSRQAKIELTRYPDHGSRNALFNVDSRFLLKIQAEA